MSIKENEKILEAHAELAKQIGDIQVTLSKQSEAMLRQNEALAKLASQNEPVYALYTNASTFGRWAKKTFIFIALLLGIVVSALTIKKYWS
jgi:hypothetical protein